MVALGRAPRPSIGPCSRVTSEISVGSTSVFPLRKMEYAISPRPTSSLSSLRPSGDTALNSEGPAFGPCANDWKTIIAQHVAIALILIVFTIFLHLRHDGTSCLFVENADRIS